MPAVWGACCCWGPPTSCCSWPSVPVRKPEKKGRGAGGLERSASCSHMQPHAGKALSLFPNRQLSRNLIINLTECPCACPSLCVSPYLPPACTCLCPGLPPACVPLCLLPGVPPPAEPAALHDWDVAIAAYAAGKTQEQVNPYTALHIFSMPHTLSLHIAYPQHVSRTWHSKGTERKD